MIAERRAATPHKQQMFPKKMYYNENGPHIRAFSLEYSSHHPVISRKSPLKKSGNGG